jgi:protein-tyrosine phosphatase
VDIEDSEEVNLLDRLDDACGFIEEGLRSSDVSCVLIHCAAGVSRSASVVIAYLMRKKLYASYQDAFLHVYACRPVIQPNESFVRQLIEYEKRLLLNNSVAGEIGSNINITNNSQLILNGEKRLPE